MEMASTCSIDRILLDLESILNNFRGNNPLKVPYDVRGSIKHMKVLKTFLMYARKWSQSNDLYLQSDDVAKKVSLPSFLSCVEDTFHIYEEDIHSLSHRSETDYSIVNPGVFPKLVEQIKSFKQEIIQVYFTLASSRSLQSNSCMTDDELMEFIDLILQNLADLTNGYMDRNISESSISAALSAQVQALEAKLTFLKSFIPFAKMRGTADIPALLLSHFEVVALNAARLSYMCSLWDDDPGKRGTNRWSSKPYQSHHPHPHSSHPHRHHHHHHHPKVYLNHLRSSQPLPHPPAVARPPPPAALSTTKPPSFPHLSSNSELSADFSGRRSTRFVSKMHFGRPKSASSSSRHSSVAEEALLQAARFSGDDARFDSILLSYMCSFWGDDPGKRWTNRWFCSMIYEQQQKITPIDFHVYEIYKEVLRATRSSKSLHDRMMDKQILSNFNDSLISCLWELLCCSSNFVDSMKDEMRILYAGLRFLRSILREHHEMMDEQNEKIGALLSEAGIIIFSPTLSRVIEGEVSFSESTQVLDFCDMLANTNIHIKHVKDQISGSSTIESFPNSSHSLRAPEVNQTSSRMLSKGKMPIAHEVMVGLDDEAAKVIERLIWGPEQVEIVPIVGMAGVGKTTLAKKVYNDSSVICDFHIRLWCTVSQEFNMKSLLLQILCSGGKHSRMDDEFQNLDEHALLHKLYQRLKKNRYLVVFDDVWNIKVWNALRISFPDDKNGSRIIFTSRSSNVASQVKYGGEPHKIRHLTVKESFELLQKKVFGEEGCPKAFHGFAVEIAEKCRGLPFAVVVVAGILASIKHDILLCEKFAESLTSTMVSGTDQWKKSLELSYEHLPYHLKECLLYFASFREDEKIGAKKLMRLWIAEGFVETIEGKRSEDIAEEYLMDLIGRNLVMVRESRSIGGVKTCYIHDLIFEFCKVEAKEKNFLQVLRGYDELSTFNEPPFLRRLSICSSGKDFIKSRLFCPHLSSLLFFEATPGDEFRLHNISFLFCICKHLEVLNLEGINLRLKELPIEVESLLCLRYLALKAWNMEFIPPSIAKLSHLETFHLDSYLTVSLPGSIWNMKKLRHVCLWGGVVIGLSSNDNVVENLSTLPNLDTLSTLYLCLDQEGNNILRRIPSVRRLKIFNRGEQNRVCCNMSRLVCLESLTFDGDRFSGSRERVELSFPVNLKKLSLDALGLSCRKMSSIEQLPNLEVLKLRQQAMDGQRWELMEGGFPKLRVLTLSMLDIVEWTEADPDSDDYFPCLQQLKLHGISNLEMMPSCLGRISTLETIDVIFCGYGVESLVREIEEAQKNYGNENLKIIITH